MNLQEQCATTIAIQTEFRTSGRSELAHEICHRPHDAYGIMECVFGWLEGASNMIDEMCGLSPAGTAKFWQDLGLSIANGSFFDVEGDGADSV